MRTFAYTTSSEQLKDGLRYDKKSYSVARNRPLRLDDSIGPAGCCEVQPVLLDDHDDHAGAEVALSKHSTLGATFNLNPWTIGADNKIQHWFVRPEYRYWVTEKYTRLFFGVHLMGGGFEVGGFRIPIIGDRFLTRLKTNYFTGSFVAGGVSIGYQSTSAPTGTSKSRAARVWHASSTTGSRPTPPCAKELHEHRALPARSHRDRLLVRLSVQLQEITRHEKISSHPRSSSRRDVAPRTVCR